MSSIDLAARVRSSKHLPFLDGIRGVAAAYVVFTHAVGLGSNFQPPIGRTHYLLQSLVYGQVAVAAFIVLSGYCLALPYLRRGSLAEMDRRSFCRKRVWRILPPYYAALLLSLATDWAVSTHPRPTPDLSTGSILAHLTLFHDFRADWNHAINSPMWSVAVEWQIYFVFAFALFPVWRRFGIIAVLATALTLGLLPHFLCKSYNFDWAHPWYLFSFALGLLAAVVTETDRAGQFATFLRTRSGPLFLAICALLVCLYAFKSKLGDSLFLITDTLEGALAALLIVRFEYQRRAGVQTWPRRLVESPAALALGAISYSLYLFHWPVLYALNAIEGQHFRPEVRCWFLLLVGSPLAALVSFASYLALERPLIAKRHRPGPEPAAPYAVTPSGDRPTLLVQP